MVGKLQCLGPFCGAACAEIAEETLEEARLETGSGIPLPLSLSGFVNKCVNPGKEIVPEGSRGQGKIGYKKWKGKPWGAVSDPTTFPEKTRLGQSCAHHLELARPLFGNKTFQKLFGCLLTDSLYISPRNLPQNLPLKQREGQQENLGVFPSRF